VAQRDAATASRYVESLATPGKSGTLDDRMTSSLTAGRVRAKTGYINGVSALSGYVERDDGRTFVFSILVNYPHTDGLHRGCWRKMQDEICELLASVKA
jgi:D-alanyl-D-alanine carboxypeptidase